jgi:predicted nucleotidyltransferase
MDTASVIATLRANEALLRQRGVVRAALFGSTARDEAGPESDVDIMVDIDPGANIDLYAYTGIILFIQDLFQCRVDVADRGALKPGIKESAEKDAVFAF